MLCPGFEPVATGCWLLWTIVTLSAFMFQVSVLLFIYGVVILFIL